MTKILIAAQSVVRKDYEKFMPAFSDKRYKTGSDAHTAALAQYKTDLAKLAADHVMGSEIGPWAAATVIVGKPTARVDGNSGAESFLQFLAGIDPASCVVIGFNAKHLIKKAFFSMIHDGKLPKVNAGLLAFMHHSSLGGVCPDYPVYDFPACVLSGESTTTTAQDIMAFFGQPMPLPTEAVGLQMDILLKVAPTFF